MHTFFERLRDYWESVGKVLRGEAEVARVFPNTTDKGESREQLYVAFLRAHVPAFCTVSLGGYAFGADGSESRQIDVLVASGSSLRFDFLNRDRQGISFASVDGLVAAVSLKSRLDGREITNAVENLASLPPVAPIKGRYHPLAPPLQDYESWPLKVVYSPDGVGVETALERLQSATAQIPSTRWPDFVHVCGKYVLVRIGPKGGQTRDGKSLPPNSFFAQTGRPDAWAFSMVTQRIQSIEQSMRMMLFSFEDLLDRLPT